MKKIIEKIKNYNLHKFYFQLNSDGNIVKHVPNNDYFEWECNMYKYLLKNQKLPISLPITPSKDCFIYQTNTMKPLIEILSDKKKKNFILNELFSYVFNFRHCNFVHGNLHIYNIFYDNQTKQFYCLDLSDSNFIENNININPNYKQHFYSRLVEKQSKYYCDLLSIFSSLKIYFKNDQKTIDYITERILVFIPKDILTEYIIEEDLILNAQRLFKTFTI